MLIVGDLGFGVIDDFKNEFPDNFINSGIAEQNMLGMAAGMAYSGYKVFIYSIANFPTFRAFEQIRNELSYHKLDVTIISVGSGLSYGVAGYSHFAVEDLSIMRSLPNFRIYSPASEIELGLSFYDSLDYCGPKYIRIGKSKELEFHNSPNNLTLSNGYLVLHEGPDGLIIFLGTIADEVLKVYEKLLNSNLQFTIISVCRVSPLDMSDIDFRNFEVIVTVEEHSAIGGLRTIIIEELFAEKYQGKFLSFNTNIQSYLDVGDQTFLREKCGLDAKHIFNVIMSSF